MFFYNVEVAYCVLILCAKVVISSDDKKKSQKGSDVDFNQTFAKLLKTIVTVNEERMKAMEKMTRLQDYMLTKNKLKTDDYDYDSMEEYDNRIFIDFPDITLRRSERKARTRSMCNRLYEDRNTVYLWMTRFLKLACRIYGIALSERVCNKSIRELCTKFHCNQKSERGFNSECHENCNKHFEQDDKLR